MTQKNEDLKAARDEAKAANDALETAIRNNPDLMAAAKKLLDVSAVVAPTLVGVLGGPVPAVVATTAIKVAQALIE